jgi:hypothetical protein
LGERKFSISVSLKEGHGTSGRGKGVTLEIGLEPDAFTKDAILDMADRVTDNIVRHIVRELIGVAYGEVAIAEAGCGAVTNLMLDRIVRSAGKARPPP